MGDLIHGKKCFIFENESERNLTTTIINGIITTRKGRGKKYEVFKIRENGTKTMFPLDTPYYEPLGWDKLKDAKAFFLLQEI